MNEQTRIEAASRPRSAHRGMPDAARKYQPYPLIDLKDRTWPSTRI